MNQGPLARLAARSLTLPVPPKPGGSYVPVRVLAGIAYVACQFPIANGKPVWTGRIGRELNTETARAAAELCALNVLAQMHAAVGLEAILGLNRIEAFMQTVEGWDEFPKVLDGASDLFLDILGPAGVHARAPIGVERLPLNMPIELLATFTLKS